MITIEQIRERVVEAIKQSGISQTTLAEKLHIRQQTVSDYINGKAMPSLDTFANLCVVLDLDANDILCIR